MATAPLRPARSSLRLQPDASEALIGQRQPDLVDVVHVGHQLRDQLLVVGDPLALQLSRVGQRRRAVVFDWL